MCVLCMILSVGVQWSLSGLVKLFVFLSVALEEVLGLVYTIFMYFRSHHASNEWPPDFFCRCGHSVLTQHSSSHLSCLPIQSYQYPEADLCP